MPTPSVSFRISRNTEELAETIHALSRRLVAMEQRLVAMERQVAQVEDAAVEEIDPQESASLANVERLLLDCRQLLAAEAADTTSSSVSFSDQLVAADLEEGSPESTPRDVAMPLTSLKEPMEGDDLEDGEDSRPSGFRHAA